MQPSNGKATPHGETALNAETASRCAARDVAFTAEIDGSEQRYLEVLPPHFQAGKTHHVLIALHGHGSDRHQCVSERGTNEWPEFQAAQDAAARHAMIYISPDYRALTSWMGPHAEADLLQIIAALKARYTIGKVLLSGGSMGGSSALTFAALHPELVDGVCAQNGTANHLEFENFQDAIAVSFGGTKADIPLEYKKRSAEYWPERLTMPLALAAGGHDDIVPPHSVVRLAAVLQSLRRPVQLIFRADGGHSTSYNDTMKGLEFVIQNTLA